MRVVAPGHEHAPLLHGEGRRVRAAELAVEDGLLAVVEAVVVGREHGHELRAVAAARGLDHLHALLPVARALGDEVPPRRRDVLGRLRRGVDARPEERARVHGLRRGVEGLGVVLGAAHEVPDDVVGAARPVDDRVEVRVRRLRVVAGLEDGARAELDHAQHLAAAQLVHVVVALLAAAVAVDDVGQVELLLRPLEHALLGRARGAEPVDVDRLRLAEPVHARHGLEVRLRVPVRVVEHARVRGLQVDAQAARARRHEEDEERARRLVERAHVDDAAHAVRRAREAAEGPAPEAAVVV